MSDDSNDCVSSTITGNIKENFKRSATRSSTMSSDGNSISAHPNNKLNNNSAFCSCAFLPNRISDWTSDHLNSLGIDIMLSEPFTPEEIIHKVFDKLFLEPDKAQRFKEHILFKICTNGMKKFIELS